MMKLICSESEYFSPGTLLLEYTRAKGRAGRILRCVVLCWLVDSDDEEDEEAEKVKQERVAAYQAKRVSSISGSLSQQVQFFDVYEIDRNSLTHPSSFSRPLKKKSNPPPLLNPSSPSK